MITIAEEYKARPIYFLGLWEINDWKLKVYGIAYARQRPGQALIEAACQVIEDRLEASAGDTHHYGIGFVGIHEGKTANFVFIDWWADENELRHHVYVSPLDQPTDLKYMTPTGLTACVWDLLVIHHERNAWVKHVLKKPAAPDLEGYLETTDLR